MKNNPKWWSILLIGSVLLLAGSLSACKSPPTQSPSTDQSSPQDQLVEAKVIRVIDGDTIEVGIEGSLYKVRYIGIDTPEMVHPPEPAEYFSKEASEKNRELVDGKTVRLEKDVSETDEHGRLLRYVWVGDMMVNAELVKLGYAKAVTYPPDVKYDDLFVQLQREAKEACLGLWGESPPTAPFANYVQITRIFYDGLVFRVESDEYVEIKNLGSEPQDLAGWLLKDISEGYPSFTFPHYILAPGAAIRVYTNELHPEWGGFSFGYGKAIWNNKDPDIAALYNTQGQELSRKSY